MSRYRDRDPQHQVGEKYLYFFNLRSNIRKPCMFKQTLTSDNCELTDLIIKHITSYNAVILFFINHGKKSFFQFEIIIKVLVRSFRFISPPLYIFYFFQTVFICQHSISFSIAVYYSADKIYYKRRQFVRYYEYIFFFNVGIVFIRHNLTFVDVRL